MGLYAVLVVLSTGGFWGEHKPSWQTYYYASIERCREEQPVVELFTKFQGLRGVRTSCQTYDPEELTSSGK